MLEDVSTSTPEKSTITLQPPLSDTMLLTLLSSFAICGSSNGNVTRRTSSDKFWVLILALSFLSEHSFRKSQHVLSAGTWLRLTKIRGLISYLIMLTDKNRRLCILSCLPLSFQVESGGRFSCSPLPFRPALLLKKYLVPVSAKPYNSPGDEASTSSTDSALQNLDCF